MAYVLGIDLGTSSAKAVLADLDTGSADVAQFDYAFDAPAPGWAEQDPAVWWTATRRVIRAVTDRVRPGSVAALSFSGQMHGLVALDINGCPVRPAIIWCDQRSADLVRPYQAADGQAFFYEQTGNALHTGFALASLLWLKQHEPDVYRRIHRVCAPKDYMRFMMTGQLATEQTDAAGTAAFDVKAGCWSEKVLQHFDLDCALFPPVYLPAAEAAPLRPCIAETLGLNPDCKVIFGGADQVMQALGNGILAPGVISVNIGTGGQIFSVLPSGVPDRAARGGAHIFNYLEAGQTYFMGAILSAGLSLRWLKNDVLGMDDYRALDEAAAETDCSPDNPIFLPYLIGERSPHADPDASAMFFGIRLKHRRGHLIRSVMEGVVFALRDNLQLLRGLGADAALAIASGGGARSALWLQLQSDILNLPIRVAETREQAALGAAMTAAVGAGYFSTYQAAADALVSWREDIVYPDPDRVRIYNDLYALYRQLYPCVSDQMRQQAGIAGRQSGSSGTSV